MLKVKTLARLSKIFFKLVASEKTPEGLRLTFEELGPTFVKLGQLLSARPDLVPRSYTEEFRKLLDHEDPVPYSIIEKILQEELGTKKVLDIFQTIDKKPISSASIGQVHVATLKHKEKVAVKVRRPDIKELIEQDSKILSLLAGLLERFSFFKGLGIKRIVNEFSWWISKELDFRIEAEKSKTLAVNLKEFEFIKIPKIYDSFTSERVLVAEYMNGITVNEVLNMMKEQKITDPGKLKLPFKINFDRLVSDMIECYVFKQMLSDGFFHGDPHPANLIFLPGDRIGLVDFGITAVLDKKEHNQVLMTILSIIENDPKMLLSVLTAIAEKEFTKKEELEITDAISEELHKIHGGTLKEASIGELILNIISLGRKYNLHWSPGIVLGMRAIALIEGIGLRLVPNDSIIERLKPYIRKYLAKEALHKLSEEELYKNILKILEFSQEASNLKDLISDKGIKVVVNDGKIAQ